MSPLPHRYAAMASGGPAGYARARAIGLPDIRLAQPTQYDGPGDAWTPEHLLLAAVEACFIFTFRAVAQAAHLNFQYLDVTTEGTVDRQDRVRFTEIVLRPRLTISDDVDPEDAIRLLHKAERACLVSASLTTPIRVEPELVKEAILV
jgi:organic hydroperoxide reductase OsmC/OhrA